MSQNQYPYNTYQPNTQSQMYNPNPNQDVAYTQQQAYPAATQFQYQMNNQESVMMPMNPYQQSFNPVVPVNQNQGKVKKEDKDIQNIMPNKQANPKLPKQKSTQKTTKASTTKKSNSTPANSSAAKAKTSPAKGNVKAADKKKTEEVIKLESISTALPSDPLDLERNSGVPDFIKKLYR